MSGGVGPTYNNEALPKEEEHKIRTGKTTRLVSFRQLIILAVMIALSASGLVTIEDFLFTVLTVIYFFFFLSKYILPPHKNPNRDALLTSSTNKIFGIYVASAGVVGLLIPICYIFQGIIQDDKRGVTAAAPHVFLLASQVFMEGLAATCGFSAPARILVPIAYNARRILTLVDWIMIEFSTEYAMRSVSARQLYAGKALAVVNLGIWSFNLFGVLIPVYLPRAFKRYYGSDKQN